ncbi:hypothetical protein C8Z91_18240 [Paenibacillus elgii]|uniref:Uncharacterized protein n=1 Tax=Paenibacillus elgii TaxID=189691 RepID=A0A2T6G0L6_9BACL|nr:hypothetical protein C8Z91_18240 [Paenibacillus elgii]
MPSSVVVLNFVNDGACPETIACLNDVRLSSKFLGINNFFRKNRPSYISSYSKHLTNVEVTKITYFPKEITV